MAANTIPGSQPGARIQTLIVEDEPLAARRLRAMLEAVTDVDIIGEAASGPEAVQAIVALGPDLVFLDVQIPDLDGFGVLAAVREAGMPLPAVVFVTAFHQYARRALEAHAVDYLLKPYDQSRLAAALERTRGALMRNGLQELRSRMIELLEATHRAEIVAG